MLQYQVVQRTDGLLVRIVVRDPAPRGLAAHVRSVIQDALAGVGASLPVEVEVVDAIEREPGHAAKVKLVVSEVPRAA